MTLRDDAKDKGTESTTEENSTWVRGERRQSEAEVDDWRLGGAGVAEPESGETNRGTNSQPPRECDSPLFSMKMYLRRPSCSSSSTTDSSSQQSDMGVDCAGIVLNCLFCRFYDMILMLPSSCGKVANHCCPNYKQVNATVESTASSDDDSFMDCDCGYSK
ncbi:myoD family inhibitor domain-containing protein 2 [Myripristis murdjan]|uniref:myoD family inhibitor domain-containing protein 2 n=1 Tax=Myripristis murdjan TaxID=586833 RepID=UPI001175E3DD|nr:myoD family inhibitor domain-containing protein 2-like [Myripristis murdjan]